LYEPHRLSPAYLGFAQAMGNIHDGTRVFAACFRWERPGMGWSSGEFCSIADSSTGRWEPGDQTWVVGPDSLRTGDRYRTYFHPRFARIPTNIF